MLPHEGFASWSILPTLPRFDTPPRVEDAGPAEHFVDNRAEAAMVTVSQRIGATPAGDFAWRPPSPPHIAIPQAADEKPPAISEFDGFEVDGSRDHEEQEILKIIIREWGEQPIAVNTADWEYEWRRNAQPILPFLYLGPSAAARDINYLRSEGITLLLVIRNTTTAQARLLSGEKVAKQLGIETLAVDVQGNQGLIVALPWAVKIINDHLISFYRQNTLDVQNQDGHTHPAQAKVLVFCETGNERSAAVIAAYLISMYQMDLVTAVQYMQCRRFCIALDDGLKHLLLSFHNILQARKAVASATAMQVDFDRGKSPMAKRGRDEMVDNDADNGDPMDEDDLERFGNRAGFVPFYDVPPH